MFEYELIAVSRSGKNPVGYLISGYSGIFYLNRDEFLKQVLDGNIMHIVAHPKGNSYALATHGIRGGIKSIREMTPEEKSAFIGNKEVVNTKQNTQINKNVVSSNLNKDPEIKKLIEKFSLNNSNKIKSLESFVLLTRKLYHSILKDNNLLKDYGELSFMREDNDINNKNSCGIRADFDLLISKAYCGTISIVNIFGDTGAYCYIYTSAFNYLESDDPEEMEYKFNFNDMNERCLVLYKALKDLISQLEKFRKGN